MWGAVFPGQGSQAPGMGRFLYEEFPVARQTFEEASDTLSLDFKKLCFEGSEADLALTANTQPCLLLVSTATFRVLAQQLDFRPTAAAGHSIGEYAAVVASGAMKFADAMVAVRVRGEAMQAAVPVGEGAMVAVMGLDPEQVNQLCAWAENESGTGPVQAANLNAPGQIVISGSKKALDWLVAHFRADVLTPPAARAKFIPLKVSAPFHCSMMMPAEEKMAEVLGKIHFAKAQFPIVQNVSAQAVQDGEQLKSNLVMQVSRSVRWIECVQQLVQLGVDRAVECGTGKVLSGLIKKIDSSAIATFNINSLQDLKVVEDELKR